MNEKQFIASASNIPAKLTRAVIRQCGGWESFAEDAPNVCNGGADGGFHGFIYYTETVAFAKRNKAEILELARSMANDLGEPGAYSLIAGFVCLKRDRVNADTVADAVNSARHPAHKDVMNSLAWYALEEVSRAYVDAMDNAE